MFLLLILKVKHTWCRIPFRVPCPRSCSGSNLQFSWCSNNWTGDCSLPSIRWTYFKGGWEFFFSCTASLFHVYIFETTKILFFLAFDVQLEQSNNYNFATAIYLHRGNGIATTSWLLIFHMDQFLMFVFLNHEQFVFPWHQF